VGRQDVHDVNWQRPARQIKFLSLDLVIPRRAIQDLTGRRLLTSLETREISGINLQSACRLAERSSTLLPKIPKQLTEGCSHRIYDT
jgi:hypothetical protein